MRPTGKMTWVSSAPLVITFAAGVGLLREYEEGGEITNLAIDSAVPTPRGNLTTQHGIAHLFGSRDRVLKRSATQFEDDEEPQAIGGIDLVPLLC